MGSSGYIEKMDVPLVIVKREGVSTPPTPIGAGEEVCAKCSISNNVTTYRPCEHYPFTMEKLFEAAAKSNFQQRATYEASIRLQARREVIGKMIRKISLERGDFKRKKWTRDYSEHDRWVDEMFNELLSRLEEFGKNN